jgi:hypothetical protein
MSRLDPKEDDVKTVTSMGPSPTEIRKTILNKSQDPVDLGPITTAASYADRVQARRMSADSLKGKGKPLGGAPPLELEKMKALATSMMPQPQFAVEPPPDTHQQLPQSNGSIPEARPAMGGVGSGYYINQEMAKGKVDHPVSLKGAQQMEEESKQQAPMARKPLSSETLQALQMAKASVEVPPPEVNEAPLNPLKTDSTSAELEQAAEKMLNPRPELFDFDSISAARTSLTSKARRKKIEDGLESMDIADMIVRREIQQTVPIVAAKLNYTFRTFNQHENLFSLRYVYDFPGSVGYVEELLNTCKLVCSLVAINGALLPDHRKGVGTDKEEVDKELFAKKMFHVANLPVQLIADVSVNAIWFNERVTKLFSLENLKNG